MNYYDILEISRNASPEVIQNAYKTLAKKYHPDIFQGDKAEAEEQMKRLNEAYEILSDPQSRMEYDHKLKNEQPHTASSDQKENDNADESKTSNVESPPVQTAVKNKRKKPFFIIRWGFITLLMFFSIMFEAKWLFWVSILLGCVRFITNKKEPVYKTRGLVRVISIGVVGFMIFSCYVMHYDDTQTTDTVTKSDNVVTEESNKIDYSETSTDFDNTTIEETETTTLPQNDILQDKSEQPETYPSVSEDTVTTDSSNLTEQETEEEDNLPIILNRDFSYICAYADKYDIKLCHERKIKALIKDIQNLLEKSSENDVSYVYRESSLFVSEHWVKTLHENNAEAYYIGKLKDNKPSGLGILINIADYENSGDILCYAGYFENGNYNGIGATVSVISSHVIYCGEFKDGLYHGEGQYINFPSGDYELSESNPSVHLSITVGDYKNSSPDGKFKLYSQGYLYMDADMDSNGTGKMTTYFSESDQIEYKGEVKNLSYHGKGTLYNENGEVIYSGEWKNGDCD